jgi:hypothetical protein
MDMCRNQIHDYQSGDSFNSTILFDLKNSWNIILNLTNDRLHETILK